METNIPTLNTRPIPSTERGLQIIADSLGRIADALEQANRERERHFIDIRDSLSRIERAAKR